MPFVIMSLILSILLFAFGFNWLLIGYGLYFVVAFMLALFNTKNIIVSILVIPAILIQFLGYGYGFLKSTLAVSILNKNPELSMAEVAYSCGFATSQYFSTVFKRQEKCTPLEYKTSLSVSIWLWGGSAHRWSPQHATLLSFYPELWITDFLIIEHIFGFRMYNSFHWIKTHSFPFFIV